MTRGELCRKGPAWCEPARVRCNAALSTARMYACIKAAGFDPDAVYRECVRLLSQSAISSAAFEPPGLKEGGCVQQKTLSLQGASTLQWHGDDKVAFLESAKRLPHPRQSPGKDLPQDLLDAVALVVGKGTRITAWREKRMQLIQDVADQLQPLSARMRACMADHVLHVCGGYHLALMAAICDATKFPDVFIVRRFIKGFPVYGMLAATGVYAQGRQEPERDFRVELTPEKNYQFNAWLKRSVAHRAQVAWRAGADSDTVKSMRAVWEATVQEVQGGWCSGTTDPPVPAACQPVTGLTQAQLEDHPWVKGKSYRLIRRFGVYQNDKWRPSGRRN